MDKNINKCDIFYNKISYVYVISSTAATRNTSSKYKRILINIVYIIVLISD